MIIHPGKNKIQGEACLLIEDYIGEAVSDESLLIEKHGSDFVFCALAELKRLRREHPGLPVYGIWQILIASGAVERLEKGNTHTIYFDESKKTGQNIEFHQGRTKTTSLTLYGDAGAGEGVGVCELVLPESPIRSLTEQVSLKRSRRRTRVGRYAGAAVATGVAFFVSNLFIGQVAESRADRIINLKNEVAERSGELNQAAKFTKTNYIQDLFPLMFLSMRDADVRVERMVFGNRPYQMRLGDRHLPWDVFKRTEVTQIRYLSDGAVDVSWK